MSIPNIDGATLAVDASWAINLVRASLVLVARFEVGSRQPPRGRGTTAPKPGDFCRPRFSPRFALAAAHVDKHACPFCSRL